MKKQLSNTKIILLCLSDFAKGIFTGMIANYLIYFFLPTAESGITVVISQGYVALGVLTLIGVVKAIGHIIDAFTDPLIAHWSDRCTNRNGRRIPFMRWASIPYGLSALLIFCPPVDHIHWINNIWVSVFIWLYFIFYTAYMIPHGALFPELITNHKKRLWAYSISSLCFVSGSALVYMTPIPVNMFKESGMSALSAYQLTFGIMTVIGVILLLVSAFCINEKEYTESKIASIKLFPAVKAAFQNREFRMLTAGQLLEYTSMAFFQATIMYYITILLGLPEAQAPIILGLSIACSVLLYPLTIRISKRVGKKQALIFALFIFIISYLIIFFGADWPIPPLAKGLMLSVLVSFPFAALNILPHAMMADVIQYDTIVTGTNKEGIFSAAKSFITKLGQSIAIMIVPSIISIGSLEGSSVSRFGIKMTAVVSAVFCALSIIVFYYYDEKKIVNRIENEKSIIT
ncbi:MAG: MFS transporter [Spirochaetales bacterium]|nr:MFS transporter [Spirochaetales bacterium]